jgi:integrase
MAICHICERAEEMELNARQQAQAANLRTHLTEGEIADLLELARKTDPRAWAIFALAFNHGLRVTEVLNLRLEGDINWKDRTVRIARLKGSMTTTQALVEMRGKPALSEISALRAYLKVRIEDGSGKLFYRPEGTAATLDAHPDVPFVL